MYQLLKFILVLITTIQVALIYPNQIFADSEKKSVKREMQNAYKHFADLQEFLLSEKKFKDEQNKAKITNSIKGLHEAFLTVQVVAKNKKKFAPGFIESADALSVMLENSKTLYENKHHTQAFTQLKNVSNNCISCHASFKTAVKFNVSGKTDSEKADFYLATRQLSKAKDAFYKNALNAKNSEQRIKAMKRWILIYTRIESNPKPIAKVLKKLKNLKDLSAYEKEMLDGWIESVNDWQSEKLNGSLIEQAETLIEKASAKEDFIYESVGTIELLRATALLHRILKNESIEPETKRNALHMLGFAYLKMPGYLINEAPDIYLIQCIREFPATPEAKKSYKLYQILTRNRYERKGYNRIPSKIRARLKDLHDTAYGMPSWRL